MGRRAIVMGVPLDLGGSRRGTDMGPSAIRYARLQESLTAAGLEVIDRGDVPVPVPETLARGDERAHFVEAVAEACERLADWVEEALREGAVPVVLGGDHSIAIGTVSGAVRALGEVGLVWFDAHGDFNTPETSPTGNVHGMPVAVLVGRGHPRLLQAARPLSEASVVLVGVRDLDPGEREALRRSDVHVFTMREIDELGVATVVRRAVALAARGGRRVVASVDLDVVDPMYAPGVATPVPGGLTYREAHLAMEILAEAGVLVALEVVEVNPILDTGNRTAALAVELVASALGQRIL
ncbi:MAG: arginase [Clostridia bacterium]|nr:arginase [Clostridia bacterium]